MIKRPLLTLASTIYDRLTSWRNDLYDRGLLKSYLASIPVVSVGNISAGGNAKTPICIFLAEQFKKRGWRPALLSRGYGGKIAGPHQVTASDQPEQVGDEPLLIHLRTQVPVIIARDRVAGAKFIEKLSDIDVIILDDGFQHRRLARQIDLIAVDISDKTAIDHFCQGLLLPTGMLRENRDRALKRAQLLVLAERGLSKASTSQEILPLLDLIPAALKAYRSSIRTLPVRSIQGEFPLNKGSDIVAFSGIAKPTSFFETLRQLGLKVVAEVAYRDHYPFSEKDIQNLRERYPKLPLVCTEKDAVKLKKFTNLAGSIYYMPIEITVEPQQEFFAEIEELLLQPQ